jgi:EAL domain-containing protein (putative c-di-GMP-specific phosphodiesterase class I)
MRVVAEGVETEAQFTLLRASGCDEVQGYLMGRPLSIDNLHSLFKDGAQPFRLAAK